MLQTLCYTGSQKQWNSVDDIEDVVNDLNSNLHSIETLKLSGNTLGVEAADRLTEPLSNQSKLERLLWNDLFTGRLKSEISVALKSLSIGLMKAEVHLVELNLSDNAFGPNGVVGVTDLLASPCCYTLKILNMNNQGLGHDGCRKLINALTTSRVNSNKQGMNLEVFIAGRNRLENAGMKMFTELFADGMNSLKELVLLQNGIGIHGVEGVEDLILSIKNHANLKVLNISDNTIKPNGMKRLSKILPFFEQLEEIYMGDCLLGNNGVDCLTKIIDTMSNTLKTISISGNEIHGRSARQFISTVVKTQHSIEKINLTENEIKKSDLREIKDILAEYEKGNALIEAENESGEENSDEESEENSEENSDEESNEETNSEESTCESEYSQSEASEHSIIEEINGTKNLFSNTSFVFTKNVVGNDIGNLFNSSTSTFMNGSARSNLFAKTNQPNIFKLSTTDTKDTDSKFGENICKGFSFLEAAKATPNPTDVTQLKEFIVDNLKSNSLMSIKESLFLTKNLGKVSLDSHIYKVAENYPENAVRIGLILCKNTTTFDVGVTLIDYVLTSSTSWPRATNAILVEMNCIKSEEKHFVPFCDENYTLPIKVLENILDMKSSIPNEVKSNLSVVLKNLAKISNNDTDDLLKKLEYGISDLKI